MTIDEPIMTSKEKSARLIASDPTPSAANDGDPLVSMIPPTDEAVELGGHVSHNDMDMEIEQGPASSALKLPTLIRWSSCED